MDTGSGDSTQTRRESSAVRMMVMKQMAETYKPNMILHDDRNLKSVRIWEEGFYKFIKYAFNNLADIQDTFVLDSMPNLLDSLLT